MRNNVPRPVPVTDIIPFHIVTEKLAFFPETQARHSCYYRPRAGSALSRLLEVSHPVPVTVRGKMAVLTERDQIIEREKSLHRIQVIGLVMHFEIFLTTADLALIPVRFLLRCADRFPFRTV